MQTQIAIEDIAGVLGVTTQQAEGLAQSEGVAKGRKLTPQQARAVFSRKGFQFPKRNIVFHCLKGGAAKTTLAYNSAYRLSQLGARVLLVDLDKQANATHSFRSEDSPFCFVDVVTNQCKVSEAIVPVSDFLDLLPSSLENARLEMELIHLRRNPQTFYKELFAPIRARYDCLVFDLPPDLSHNTYMSTLFADWIVVPVNADAYSLSGMRMTLESIEGIRKEFAREDLEVLVVWSKFDGREKSALAFSEDLQHVPGARLLPTVIRTDVTFKTAQARSQSVFQLRKRSNAKEDLDLLVREIAGLNDVFSPLSGDA